MTTAIQGNHYRAITFRLFGLFMRLRAAGDAGITANVLAEEFECSTRTIYRGVETLRELGVQIQSQNEGWPVNGYRVINSECPCCKHRLAKN